MDGERRELIVGQQRVLGLLTFLASPFLIVILSVVVHPVATLIVGTAIGAFLVRSEPHRAIGIGLLAGTVATCGALLLLLSVLDSVD